MSFRCRLVAVVFLLSTWASFSHYTQRDIKIVNNGYTGITIAISERVQENEDLIENIKTAFTEASKFLYTVTKNRLYFKNITIVVPKTWSPKADYVNVTGSRFESSPIRIDIPSQDLGLTPYVFGISGCGGQGQYMHLTPELLSEKHTSYGTHDHIIVHEWGHLRWGVYDEYPNIRDKRSSDVRHYLQFYSYDGSWKPVRCTDDIQGYISTDCRELLGCHVDHTGRPEVRCKFCPSISKTTAKASLMGFQWLPSLEQFCDSDSLKHNFNATNMQNNMCEGRSIWTVLGNNSDFTGILPGIDRQDTTPSFTILHERLGMKLVLVIDVSGSMKGLPLKTVTDLTKDFIMNFPRKDIWMGIVTFNTTAFTTVSIRKLISTETRKTLVNKLPASAAGATSIGAGLQMGLNMLKSHSPVLQGSILFLLTDGEENKRPYINESILPIKDEKIKVICVAYGVQADKNLQNLASSTGGLTFVYTENTNSTALFDAFESLYKGVERIYSKVIRITDGVRVHNTFLVHRSNVKVLNVRLSLPRNLDVNVTISVITPNGQHYSSDMRYKYGIPTLKIVDPLTVGEYAIEIHSQTSANTTGNIIITTESDSNENASGDIEIVGWLSHYIFNIPEENKVTIFTSVLNDYAPVVNVHVTCGIEDEKGHYWQLDLKDNGIDDHNIVLKEKAMERFQREITIDVLTVIGSLHTTSVDVIPPAGIYTLSIAAYSFTNHTYTITWLAVGDDYEYGRASRYDVRMSQNPSLLRQNADNGMAIEAPTSPKEAGQTEMLMISLNSTSNTTYFVGIRAVDEENNMGEMSNIISISVITDKQWLPVPQDSRDDDSSYTLIILIGAGCAALMLFIVLIVIFVLKRQYRIFRLNAKIEEKPVVEDKMIKIKF